MHSLGDFETAGYAHVPGLISEEIGRALLHGLKTDLEQVGAPLDMFLQNTILTDSKTFEFYGNLYKPINTFLWGMTPAISALTGVALAPSYAYMRIYGRDHICFVHADRAACEYSLSLTLAYADGLPWALEIGHVPVVKQPSPARDFGGDPYTAIAMEVGDGVLYKGIERLHGRMTRNPNRWSAHLFLHWVDSEGPYAAQAFDTKRPPKTLDFTF